MSVCERTANNDGELLLLGFYTQKLISFSCCKGCGEFVPIVGLALGFGTTAICRWGGLVAVMGLCCGFEGVNLQIQQVFDGAHELPQLWNAI